MSELEALADEYFSSNYDKREMAYLKFDQLLMGDSQSIFTLVQNIFSTSQRPQAVILASHMIKRYLTSKGFEESRANILATYPSLEHYHMYAQQPAFGSLSCAHILTAVEGLLNLHQSLVYHQDQRDHVRMNLSLETALFIMDRTRDFIPYAFFLQKYYQQVISQGSFSGLATLFEHKGILNLSSRDDIYSCAEQCVAFLQTPNMSPQSFSTNAMLTAEGLTLWLSTIRDCCATLFNGLIKYSGLDFSKATGLINVMSHVPYRKLFYYYSSNDKMPYNFDFLQRLYEILMYTISLSDSSSAFYSLITPDKLIESMSTVLDVLFVVISVEEIYDSQNDNERMLLEIHLERLTAILTSPLFYPLVSTFSGVALLTAKVLFALRRSTRPIAFFVLDSIFCRYIGAVRRFTLFLHGYRPLEHYSSSSSLLNLDDLPTMLLSSRQVELELASENLDAASIMMKLWYKFGLNLGYLCHSSESVRAVIAHVRELCTEMFYMYLLAYLYQCVSFYKEESPHMELLVRNLSDTYSQIDIQTKTQEKNQDESTKSIARVDTPRSEEHTYEALLAPDVLASTYLNRFRSFVLAIAGNESFDLFDFSVHTRNMTSTYEFSVSSIDADMCDVFLTIANPQLLCRMHDIICMLTQTLVKIQESISNGSFMPADITTLQIAESCFSIVTSYFLFGFKVLKASSLENETTVLKLVQTSTLIFQFVGSWLQFNFILCGKDSPVTPYLINRPTYHLFSIMTIEFIDSMVDIVGRSSNKAVFKEVATTLMNQGVLRMQSACALVSSLSEASAGSDSMGFSPSEFIAPFLFDMQFQLNLLYSSVIISGQMRVQIEPAEKPMQSNELLNKLTEILGLVFYLDQSQPYYIIASTLIRMKFSKISEHYCTSQLFKRLVESDLITSSFNLAPLIYTFTIGIENVVKNYATIRMYYNALMSMILRNPINKTGQTALLVVTLCNLINLMGSPSSPHELVSFHFSVLQQNLAGSLPSYPILRVTSGQKEGATPENVLAMPIMTHLTPNESIGINAAHLTFLVSKFNSLNHANLELPMPEREFIFGYIISGLLGVLQNVKEDVPSLISYVNILSSRLGHIITCSITIELFTDLLIELLIKTNAVIDAKKLTGDIKIAASNLRLMTGSFLETLTTRIYKRYHILLKGTNIIFNIQNMLSSNGGKFGRTFGAGANAPIETQSLELLLNEALTSNFPKITQQLSSEDEKTAVEASLPHIQLIYQALFALNLPNVSNEQKLVFFERCEDRLLDMISKNQVFRLISAIIELGTYLSADSIAPSDVLVCQNIMLLIALINRAWLLDYRLHQECNLFMNVVDFLHTVLSKSPEMLGSLPKYVVRNIMAFLCEASTSDAITDTRQNRILVTLQSIYIFLANALMSNTISNSFNQISNNGSGSINPDCTNSILGCLTLFSASTIFDDDVTTAAVNIHSYIMDSSQTYDFLKAYTDPSNVLQTLGITTSQERFESSPICYCFTDGQSTAVPTNTIAHIVQGIVEKKIKGIIQASSFIYACSQVNEKSKIIAAISRINSAVITRLIPLLQDLTDTIDTDTHKRSIFTEAVIDLFMKQDTNL